MSIFQPETQDGKFIDPKYPWKFKARSEEEMDDAEIIPNQLGNLEHYPPIMELVNLLNTPHSPNTVKSKETDKFQTENSSLVNKIDTAKAASVQSQPNTNKSYAKMSAVQPKVKAFSLKYNDQLLILTNADLGKTVS